MTVITAAPINIPTVKGRTQLLPEDGITGVLGSITNNNSNNIILIIIIICHGTCTCTYLYIEPFLMDTLPLMNKEFLLKIINYYGNI